jgi:transcription initiation factor TFIID TATA-box-binding protein
MNMVEYEKINHVIIVKTHGRRCITSAFEKLRYGEHTPNSFSALTLKHRNPSATIIMFSTGNITIMGPKTHWGAMYVLEVLKQKFDLHIMHINVANIAVKFLQNASGMDIRELYSWNKRDCDCDLDLFPSCTYMVPNTTVKANFFNSGKVVVLGCNTEEKVEHVIKHLTYVIHSFRSNDTIVKIIDKKAVVATNP